MNINILLMPFVWFFQGISTLATAIFSLVKKIILFIISIFELFGKGIFQIALSIAKAIKFILLYFFKGLLFIISGIFKLVKFIIVYFMRGFYQIVSNFSNYLFIVLKFIFKYVYIILKGFFVNLYYGLKFIFIFIYKLLLLLFEGFKIIFIYIWKGIKGFGWILYKIFIYPFIYLYKNAKSIIDNFFKAIRDTLNKIWKSIISFPRKVKEGIINWYNNLSFIKDIHNRREMSRQKLLIDFDTADAVRSVQKVMYKYVAKNPNGKIEKGRLGAYSKLDVHSYLLAEGYEIYEIEVFKGFELKLGSNYKLKGNELAFFLTQLSTYIKSGIPLVDSIKILSKETRQRDKIDLFKSLIYELTMGDNFSEAMEKQGSSFPKLLVNMIRSAELAGNLSETLDDMADYYDVAYKTKKQMISAMMYPMVITVFAFAVLTFIMVFVIPQFISIYSGMNAEIPTITKVIIGISGFLQKNVIWLLLGILGVIVSLILLYKNVKIFRLFVQWMLMHFPIAGRIIIYNEVTMFAKTFGSLLNHNVFITDSMEILSKITNNEIYKMLIFDTMTNIARGEPISNSFKNQWAFPIVAYEMLVTGERTGQPGQMMNKVATYYQEEHSNSIAQIKAFIEPVMIVFLAIVVGVILLSVILPMFNLYGNMGGVK